MTPTHEFIIFESKQGIRRVQELGMEDDFHAVMDTVEEITATNTERKRRKKEKSDNESKIENKEDYAIVWGNKHENYHHK
jgi:hypothetical protein